MTTTDTKAHVLIVEDEPQMADIIVFVLAKHGMATTTARTAEAGWRALRSSTFDAVVLDVMLPDFPGLALCERIRSQDAIPILFLSALGSPEERVRGLEAGADDYLAKPFSPRELALRIEALISRSQAAAPQATAFPGFTIDQNKPTVRVNGVVRSLSATSHALLRSLAARPGTAMKPAELLNEVWATSVSAGGREMVKTAIYQLRQELGPDGAGVVQTKRGVVYVFVPHTATNVPKVTEL